MVAFIVMWVYHKIFKFCFYGAFSFNYDMKPNSGSYKIKFEVNKICKSWANIIGIISQTGKNDANKKTIKRRIEGSDIDHNYYDNWFCKFSDYIGWSTSRDINKHLPNGLFCGFDKNLKTNIFRNNNFGYCSNNNHYPTRLPEIENGDIIILEYDSDLAILTFSKETDNGKLNSSIKNLPKENTYYWFIGHEMGKLSLTIV